MFYFKSQENILAIHSRIPILPGLHLFPGMLWRSVYGGELQRTISDVDDVVPCSGWDTYAVSGAELLFEAELIWAAAHSHGALPLLDPYDMVGILHDGKTHIGAGRYAHHGHLHEAAGPYGIKVVLVSHGSVVDIQRDDIVVAVVSTVIFVLRTVVVAIHRKSLSDKLTSLYSIHQLHIMTKYDTILYVADFRRKSVMQRQPSP